MSEPIANPGVIETSPMTPTTIAAPPIPLISRSLQVPGRQWVLGRP